MLLRADTVTDLDPILSRHTVRRVWNDRDLLIPGVLFALPTLFILLCHELGHWLACRHHRLATSPPFFLPAPVGLGTFGAFIHIRSPMRSKRELFDVGVWGPIAGFLALLPILCLGVALSPPVSGMTTHAEESTTARLQLGDSLLVEALVYLVHGELAEGSTVNPHPFLLAGWVGLCATMLNLIPLARLDGGHLLYALVGRFQRPLVWLIWAGIVALGAVWIGWWIFSLFVLFLGMHHPRVDDESSPLDPLRKCLAGVALAILVLGFMPAPLRFASIGPLGGDSPLAAIDGPDLLAGDFDRRPRHALKD